ncbi:hypothetical protein GCM10023319_76070 [Nocardia iowensis]
MGHCQHGLIRKPRREAGGGVADASQEGVPALPATTARPVRRYLRVESAVTGDELVGGQSVALAGIRFTQVPIHRDSRTRGMQGGSQDSSGFPSSRNRARQQRIDAQLLVDKSLSKRTCLGSAARCQSRTTPLTSDQTESGVLGFPVTDE